eukprot:g1593.t1
MSGFRDMAFENEAWGHGDGSGDVDSSEPDSDDGGIDPRRRGPIGDITQNRSGSFSCRFCPNAKLLSEKDVAAHLQGTKHRKRFKAWQKSNRTDEQKEQYRAAKRARRKRKAEERLRCQPCDGGSDGAESGSKRRRKRGRRPGTASGGGTDGGNDVSAADDGAAQPGQTDRRKRTAATAESGGKAKEVQGRASAKARKRATKAKKEKGDASTKTKSVK